MSAFPSKNGHPAVPEKILLRLLPHLATVEGEKTAAEAEDTSVDACSRGGRNPVLADGGPPERRPHHETLRSIFSARKVIARRFLKGSWSW